MMMISKGFWSEFSHEWIPNETFHRSVVNWLLDRFLVGNEVFNYFTNSNMLQDIDKSLYVAEFHQEEEQDES